MANYKDELCSDCKIRPAGSYGLCDPCRVKGVKGDPVIANLKARVQELEADVEHLTHANMQMAPELVRLRARNKELREDADKESATGGGQ